MYLSQVHKYDRHRYYTCLLQINVVVVAAVALTQRVTRVCISNVITERALLMRLNCMMPVRYHRLKQNISEACIQSKRRSKDDVFKTHKA